MHVATYSYAYCYNCVTIIIRRQVMKFNTWYSYVAIVNVPAHSAHTMNCSQYDGYSYLIPLPQVASYFNSSHRSDWDYLHNSAMTTSYIASCTTGYNSEAKSGRFSTPYNSYWPAVVRVLDRQTQTLSEAKLTIHLNHLVDRRNS